MSIGWHRHHHHYHQRHQWACPPFLYISGFFFVVCGGIKTFIALNWISYKQDIRQKANGYVRFCCHCCYKAILKNNYGDWAGRIKTALHADIWTIRNIQNGKSRADDVARRHYPHSFYHFILNFECIENEDFHFKKNVRSFTNTPKKDR